MYLLIYTFGVSSNCQPQGNAQLIAELRTTPTIIFSDNGCGHQDKLAAVLSSKNILFDARKGGILLPADPKNTVISIPNVIPGSQNIASLHVDCSRTHGITRHPHPFNGSTVCMNIHDIFHGVKHQNCGNRLPHHIAEFADINTGVQEQFHNRGMISTYNYLY